MHLLTQTTLFLYRTDPDYTALRRLLTICENWTLNCYCICFNSWKTKCSVLNRKERRYLTVIHAENFAFFIDGKPVSGVKSFLRLDHMSNCDLSDDDDIIKQRNAFIGQMNNSLCYFKNLHSNVQYEIFQSSCSSFYGC